MEVQPAQDAGRRIRQVGLHEPRRTAGRDVGGGPGVGRVERRERAEPPQLAEGAPAVAVAGQRPVADTRQGRRGGDRLGRGLVAHRIDGREAGRRPVASRVTGTGRAAGSARSRPSRPARDGAARRPAAASARGRPSAAGWRRGSTCRGHVLDVDREARPPDDVARPVGPRREEPVDDVVDALRAAAASSSTIASATSATYVGQPHSSPTTFSGSPASAARSAAARILTGKSAPGGPKSQAVRTMASAAGAARARTPRAPPPRRPASTRRTGSAARARPPACSRGRRSAAPSNTSFVEMTIRSMPRAAQPRARTPVAVAVAPEGELRIAGAAVHVGPGRGMDDDLGALLVEPGPDGVRRVQVELRRVSRRPARAGPVNGASASPATSARPSRPPAPVTTTRIVSPPGWSRRRRGAVLALVVGVPVARPDGPPPALVRDEPVDRAGEPVLERACGSASRGPPASSRRGRSGGRGRAGRRTVRTSDQGLPRRSSSAVTTSRLVSSSAARDVVGLAGRAVLQDVVDAPAWSATYSQSRRWSPSP